MDDTDEEIAKAIAGDADDTDFLTSDLFASDKASLSNPAPLAAKNAHWQSRDNAGKPKFTDYKSKQNKDRAVKSVGNQVPVRNRIFGAIGALGGGAVVVFGILRGGPQGAGASLVGQYAGLAFGGLLLVAGIVYFFKPTSR